MEGSYREARNLKELLLVNLDLIERQQELLVEKDKRIQHLLHENDTLKCRLDRIERRMSLCSQKQVERQRESSGVGTQKRTTDNVRCAEKKTKNATFDESFQSAGQASDAASQHGLRAKPSKLKLETAGKKHIASTKDGGRVKSVDQGEESRSAAMKCRFGPDRSEMLTTDKLYYSAASHSVPDPDQLDGADVSVPSWRVNTVHSKYVMEGTENLSDSAFLKRHQKSEVEEKRRKRWDMQRLRDLHLLQKQHQQNSPRTTSQDQPQEPVSFLPSNDRVCYIDVDECIPVAVFGHAFPQLSSEQFDLPWSDAVSSETTTEARKLKKRKKNIR